MSIKMSSVFSFKKLHLHQPILKNKWVSADRIFIIALTIAAIVVAII